MKRKVTSVSRVAHQLTDPKPEFVSHVRNGANQTPFRVVKMEDFADEQSETQGETMSKKAEIQKIVFAKKQFDTDAKVKEYLEAKGYTDFDVKATKTGFEVVAKGVDDFKGDIRALETDEGVTIHAGELADGKAPLDTTIVDKSTKAAQVTKVFKFADMDSTQVKKYYDDYCCGTWVAPSGKTIADVLTEQYNDGSFPGMYQLNEAFWYAMYNLVKEGDLPGIKALTTEYGDLIVAIITALNTAGVDVTAIKAAFLKEPEKETKTMAKPEDKSAVGAVDDKTVTKTDEPKADAPAAEVKDEPAAGADAPAADDAKADEPAADAGAVEAAASTETKTDAAKAEAAPATDIADIVAKAVAAAITPLSEAVAAVSKETSEGLTALKEQVTKSDARVDELVTARTSRKSAAYEGIPLGNSEPVAKSTDTEQVKKAHDDRVFRNTLGFMGSKA